MRKAAQADALKAAFEQHLDQTGRQVARLERAFAASGIKASDYSEMEKELSEMDSEA